MALKTIRVRLKSWQEGLDGAIEAMKGIQSGKKVAKKNGTYFQDLEAARAVLTETRLSLLRAIRERKPKSVSELARMTKRDFKSVHQDVEMLRDLGLVEVKSSKGVASQISSNTSEIVFRIAV